MDRAATPCRTGARQVAGGAADERLARDGDWLTRLLRRPEAGAAGGLIATLLIFALLPGAGALYSLQGVDDLPDALGRARHHRHRRGAPDHRRRVRPVGRLDDRLRRRRDRAARSRSSACRSGAASRAAFAVAMLVGYLNGLIVVQDAAAVLHRHARLALHPARPLDRHHPRRHRAHADPLHPRRRRPTRGPRAIFNGACPDRPLPLDGRRRAGSPPAATASPFVDRHPDVDRLVDRASPRSPAGC